MAIHCQLLFSTILYVFVVISSIIVVSTITYAKSYTNGVCYLFAREGSTTPPTWPCKVNLYICGGASAYGVIMAIYHGYGTVVASRESHIGRTMWVMPWLLLNALTIVLMFICACTYSIGRYITCSEGKKVAETMSCSIKSGAYMAVVVGEGSVWVCVLLWGCLAVVEGIRLRRNRRALTREVYAEPNSSDVVNIGDIEPTA